MTSGYFATLARYNGWANHRLYRACEALGAAEHLRERAANLGSLHAVLNHALVADRVWIARIEGRSAPSLAPDQILYADLAGLKIARLAEDEHIVNMVAGIAPAQLGRPLEYRDSRGDRRAEPLGLVLAHFFNNQTHRRGQAQFMLSETQAPPTLDLIDFVRQGGR